MSALGLGEVDLEKEMMHLKDILFHTKKDKENLYSLLFSL